MQHRRRWLDSRGVGAVAFAALFLTAMSGTWTGCDAGGGNTVSGSDDDDGGAAGMGGTEVVLPCGIDCSTIQAAQCTEAVCDEETGQCVILPLSDVECDDGLFCTIGDICVDGTCTGQGENDCQLSPESWTCQGVVCNEETKSCSQVPLEEGTSCIASDPCIVGARCDANNLCTGPVNDCFFADVPNSCHVATCNSNTGECEPTPGNEGLPCIDTLCSEGGACDDAGTCAGATVKDCTYAEDACNAASCDATTGGCVLSPINEAGACDDQDGCTVGDVCTSGACISGATVASCANDDGCCGPSCDASNDNDCQEILLIAEDIPLSGWAIYRDALTAAGRQWTEVDMSVSGTQFPDAAMLVNYDTVILVAENSTDWPDAENQPLVEWMQDAGQERNMILIGKDALNDFVAHANTCAHDPCDEGIALNPSCAAYVNNSNVCNDDPTCCDTMTGTWSAACVAHYETYATCPNWEYELYQLFGMTYAGGYAGTQLDRVEGVASDPVTDVFFTDPLRLSEDSNSAGDYADPLVGPALHVGFYRGQSGGGLDQSAITRYGPSYKTVWVGFNLHDGTVEAGQVTQLIKTSLEWFKQ